MRGCERGWERQPGRAPCLALPGSSRAKCSLELSGGWLRTLTGGPLERLPAKRVVAGRIYLRRLPGAHEQGLQVLPAKVDSQYLPAIIGHSLSRGIGRAKPG